MEQGKYFTPELTEQERIDLNGVLNLDQMRFLFIESQGDTLLQVNEYGEGVKNPLLQITTRSQLDAFLKDYLFPVFEKKVGTLEVGTDPISTLWYLLFPYPFSLFEHIQVSPSELKLEIQSLAKALSQLEEKLSLSELGLVSFRSYKGEFNLLLHFVRGKRIRVGTSHDIEAFLSTFRGASPTIEDLKRFFGTSVSYTIVDIVPPEPSIRPFTYLTQAILQSTNSSISSINTLSEKDLPPQIQL